MITTVHNLLHPTGKLLARYANKGFSVHWTSNWTVPQTIAPLNWVHNVSEKTKIAVATLKQEMLEKLKYGFTTVLKWKAISKNIQTNLKISSVEAIPHKIHPFQFIIGLSFGIDMNVIKQLSVNESTTRLSPQESTNNPGNFLPHIILKWQHHLGTQARCISPNST